MVFAHYVADDSGALAGGLVWSKAHLVHGVENASMHGLEAVADIGQRAPDDDRHGVIEIAAPHLLFNVDGHNVGCTWATRTTIARRRSQRELRVVIVCHSSVSSCQSTRCRG